MEADMRNVGFFVISRIGYSINKVIIRIENCHREKFYGIINNGMCSYKYICLIFDICVRISCRNVSIKSILCVLKIINRVLKKNGKEK